MQDDLHYKLFSVPQNPQVNGILYLELHAAFEVLKM